MDIAEIAGIKGQKQVFYTIYILYPAPYSPFINYKGILRTLSF